jgi:hypothetical protein
MLDTWLKFRRGRPTLLHWHRVQPTADRHLPEIARAAGVPHLVVTEHRAPRAGEPVQIVAKSELANADAVTAVCGAVADSIVREHGIARARVRVVPNGADLPDELVEWLAARKLRDRRGGCGLAAAGAAPPGSRAGHAVAASVGRDQAPRTRVRRGAGG